jgi:hypothetical protein
VEVFDCSNWASAHTAIAQLTGITEGALNERSDVLEVSAYSLASGLVGEDIEHAADCRVDHVLFGWLFARWSVAESDKELELRHEVFGEKESFIVFDNSCDILEEIIVYDLYWVLCEIITLTDVVANNGELD